MSYWTHVNGQIRIDGLPGMTPVPEFGKIIDYSDLDYDHAVDNSTIVPCGSEGSLKYTVSEVGDGFVWLNVSIWGDLRDYDSVDEIVEWIKKPLKDHMIRSCVIDIDVESLDSTYVLLYVGGNRQWDLIEIERPEPEDKNSKEDEV